MRKPRRPLLKSFLALLLCLSLLIGSTFAWFTDSVTSSGNIIKSGNLDVEMYWSDRLLSVDSPEWQNADGVPVFDYSNWEPGYTQVRYVKISNEGSLALKWLLSIETEAQLGTIAEVIDVYYINPVSSAITSLDGLTPVGILKDVIAGHSSTSGNLLPKSAQGGNTAILAIAFHMQESAGNDYMSQSTGAFTLKLLATQLQYESDSFDNTYDKEATWPNSIPTGSVSAPVTPAADGTVANDLTMANNAGTLSATVPAGTKLADGVSELTFSVSNMENGANISIADGEEKWSLDVHVEGVAEDNDKPILIAINEALPKGLNLGNYTLYHVENGTPVAMTLVSDAAALVDHNQFTYDPATGNVILSMKSFSEIALVAQKTSTWKGMLDYSWYTKDPDATAFTIANADQLAGLSAIVGGMAATEQDRYGIKVAEADTFKGKTITLAADININDIHTDKVDASENGIVFYPIGYYNSEGTYEKTGTAITSGFKTFQGTFDGNGHTIKNFYQNTWEMKGDHDWYAAENQNYRDGMGLFGKVYGGTVKNLTVDNFSSDGEIATTGTIAAYADCGAVFENISIKNCNPRVYNIGNGGIVGCVGWYANEQVDKKVTFKNITVDNSNKISALWGSWDVACGGIVGQYYPTSGQSDTIKNPGMDFEDCHISAQIDVNNDVCANYQYYAYRYAGMIIGSIRENETVNGKSVPKMEGITARNCTVNYGIWNNYYYCELVANSLASYTHDHQFSRLTQVASVDPDTKTYVPYGSKDSVAIPSGRQNYVVVSGNGHGTENATCYHFVDGEVWTHEMAGTETVNGVEGVPKENNQHIYLPFNQLCTGYGWGVSSIGLNTYDGFENVTEGTQEGSAVKFTSKGKTEIQTGVTVSLGTLFSGNNNVNSKGVWVTVEADDGNTEKIKYTFAPDTTDWTKGTLRFTKTGKVRVTIQDYYFCTPTTITLDVVTTASEDTSDLLTFVADNTVTAQVTTSNGKVSYSTVGSTVGNGHERAIKMTLNDTSKELITFRFKFTSCGNITDNVKLVFTNNTTTDTNNVHYGNYVVTDANHEVVKDYNLTVGQEYIFYGVTRGSQTMFLCPAEGSGFTQVEMEISDWKALDYSPEVTLLRPEHAYQGNAAPYQDAEGNWLIHYRSFTGEHAGNTAEYRRLVLSTDGDCEAVSFEFKFNTSQYRNTVETANDPVIVETLTDRIDFAFGGNVAATYYDDRGAAVQLSAMKVGQWYRAVIRNPAETTNVYVMGHRNGVIDATTVNIDMDFKNLQTVGEVIISSRDRTSVLVTHTGGDTYTMTNAGFPTGTPLYWGARITPPSSNHNQLAVDFKFNSAPTDASPTMTVRRATLSDDWYRGVSMRIYDKETGELVDSDNNAKALTVGTWYTLVFENPANSPQSAYLLYPCINYTSAQFSVDFADPRVIS